MTDIEATYQSLQTLAVAGLRSVNRDADRVVITEGLGTVGVPVLGESHGQLVATIRLDAATGTRSTSYLARFDSAGIASGGVRMASDTSHFVGDLRAAEKNARRQAGQGFSFPDDELLVSRVEQILDDAGWRRRGLLSRLFRR